MVAGAHCHFSARPRRAACLRERLCTCTIYLQLVLSGWLVRVRRICSHEPVKLMYRELLDKWCERGILGLVLGILMFGPLATGAVRTPDFLVIQGLTVGVILLWGLRLWLSPRPRFLWPPICWAVVAFTC